MIGHDASQMLITNYSGFTQISIILHYVISFTEFSQWSGKQKKSFQACHWVIFTLGRGIVIKHRHC